MSHTDKLVITMRRRFTTKPLFCDITNSIFDIKKKINFYITNSIFWYYKIEFVILKKSQGFCDNTKSIYSYKKKSFWVFGITKLILWYQIFHFVISQNRFFFISQNPCDYLISQNRFCDIKKLILWYKKKWYFDIKKIILSFWYHKIDFVYHIFDFLKSIIQFLDTTKSLLFFISLNQFFLYQKHRISDIKKSIFWYHKVTEIIWYHINDFFWYHKINFVIS